MINDSSEVKDLKDKLSSQDEEVRAQTCSTLGLLGGYLAGDLLIKTFYGETQRVRDKASQALVTIADETVIEKLIALFREEDVSVRSLAMETVGKIGSVAVPMLKVSLRDEDDDIRILSANVLGVIGDSSATEALILGLLEDDNENVRYASAEALGQIAFSQEGRKDELKAFGKLGDFFPSEVLETLEVSEIAEDGAYLEAQSPADVSDYEFWLDALELRKAWRTEAGETETVEQSAPDEEIPETERAKESSIILSEDPRRDEGPTDTAPEATDLTTFSDRLGAIEELADLADVGILTPNEFQKKKQQILGGPGA